MAIVDEGIYVLSIQGMTNTKDKYMKALGVTKQTTEMNLLYDSCFHATYSYFITSAIKHDTQMLEFGFMDLMVGLFTGQIDDQLAKLSK